VTLNIRGTQSNRDGEASPDATATADRPLVQEVVDELTSWNPREFIAAFQRWHQGEMSLTHLNVLTLLEAMGPQSMGRLAESLDVSEASMTGIIDRMEKRELVVRQRDGADRRVVLVVPAPGGAQVFAELNARRRQGLGKLLSGLSDEQLEGLLEGHRALRAARQSLVAEMARYAKDSEARSSAPEPPTGPATEPPTEPATEPAP
jgi:DNA-binding MarR family transcriptional regulator